MNIQETNNDEESIEQFPEETKAERFSRVATRRLRAALKQMELLENCANTATYEYNDTQVDALFEYLDNAVSSLKKHFQKVPDERELPTL